MAQRDFFYICSKTMKVGKKEDCIKIKLADKFINNHSYVEECRKHQRTT